MLAYQVECMSMKFKMILIIKYAPIKPVPFPQAKKYLPNTLKNPATTTVTSSTDTAGTE